VFCRLFGFCFLIFHTFAIASEESFLLIDGSTNATILQMGPHIEKRISPCSTFKIALSLIGYDANVLIDEFTPIWNFKDGYDDWLPSWRAPQTPKSWMQYS
jgi:beta-lactamase class D